MRMRPAPSQFGVEPSGRGWAVERMMAATSSGLRFGVCDMMRAARPDTSGAAKEVPLARAYGPFWTQSQLTLQKLAGTVLMMFIPGAATLTSGPQSLNGERASGLPASPEEATAMVSGRLAGKVTLASPSLPVAVTMTMPKRSWASRMALASVIDSPVAPKDRLATRAPMRAA